MKLVSCSREKLYLQETFFAARSAKNQEWVLEFEGVYSQAEIFLNGVLVGTNTYAYNSFYIPLQRLRYGEENEIAVSASASVHAAGDFHGGYGTAVYWVDQ